MRVSFRTDASLQIGTGHVLRCLTLADALAAEGADCEFLCREHDGHLIEFIRRKGYVTHPLPIPTEASSPALCADIDRPAAELAHGNWLGATQAQDAEVCSPILAIQQPDWLIVDHYALDAEWEHAVAPHCRKLMVIDDLADRPHACDLLLDQTLGREAIDYQPRVPTACHLLCGSQYALLRPEFAALRRRSLKRRAQPVFRELLITMGGIDKANVTGQVLRALRLCPLPADCRIAAVMGAKAPWLDDVRENAQDLPWPTRVLVGISNMAELMADSDIAIGSAGTTSWELCCLGVPMILFMLADNQRKIARALERAGAASLPRRDRGATPFLKELLVPLSNDPSRLHRMSESAANVVDGTGVKSVMLHMGA